MKKKWVVIFIGCVLLAPGLSIAAMNWQVDFSSMFFWRGFDLNPNRKPVIQPSVTYAFPDSGFWVNAWGSISFEATERNEIDLSAGYDWQVSDKLRLTVGFIDYCLFFAENFSFKKDTTQELYGTLSFPKTIFCPCLSLYYDFNNGDGFYAQAGGSHSLKLAGQVSVDLSTQLGYNFGQWLPKDSLKESGFSHWSFGMALPLRAGKIKIVPFINLAFIFMREINPHRSEIWAGVTIKN